MNKLLVIHGIGNRSETEFKEATQDISDKLRERYELIHVFWGNFGGRSKDLADTLPSLFPGSDEDGRGVRSDRSVEHVASVIASGAIGESAGVAVRNGDDAELRQAIQDGLLQCDFIRTIEDEDVLREIGALIAASAGAGGDGHGVRSEEPTRSLASSAKAIIAAADRMIGKLTGNLGGTLNQLVRQKMAAPIALTFGDVVAYHENRDAIQQHLRKVAGQHGTTSDMAVDVMAHSLGGLIALEAALGVGGDPLWIRRLVTFGSQPAFFHVMTQRKGLAAYQHEQPVTLPNTIGAWTNLWHRLDVLAFRAAPVFRLSSGEAPLEVPVISKASEIAALKGWLHSVYWTADELANAWKASPGEGEGRTHPAG